MVACVCVCNVNIFFITLGICCGITGLSCCCCDGRHPYIPYFRRSYNIYPIFTSPQIQITQRETQKVVLVTNPYQSEIFIGFPYIATNVDAK